MSPELTMYIILFTIIIKLEEFNCKFSVSTLKETGNKKRELKLQRGSVYIKDFQRYVY